MPKKDINYSKCVIYKIVCNDLNVKDLYVGSTTNFVKRKQGHKHRCYDEKSDKYNYLVYKTIRENGGFGNWMMVEVEKYPCNDTHEALARERYWIETLNATLNIIIPTRTHREWYDDNKEKLKENKKEYYEQNKEIYKEKGKEYRELNKDKISEHKKEYRELNKDKIKEVNKEYRELNKEKIKEKDKKYYDENKDKISEQRKTKIKCICGIECTKINRARHEKSLKHQNYMKSQTEITV